MVCDKCKKKSENYTFINGEWICLNCFKKNKTKSNAPSVILKGSGWASQNTNALR